MTTAAHQEVACLSPTQRRLRARRAVEASVGTDVAHAEEVLGYSLAGGKGMRALIAHTCGDYCQLPLDVCDKIAAAIEMIHVACLVHDDVVDDAETRRHQASTNCQYGNPSAVLIGDFLYSRASQLLCDAGSLRLMAKLADATNLLAQGELIQLANAGTLQGTDVYLDMIWRKTAALFAVAAEAGATVVGDEQLAERLHVFGREAGLAFQIGDDCIDYEGREDEIGKKPGGDFAEGKVTMPFLCALELADERQQSELHELFKCREQSGSFAQARSIIEEVGALAKARQKVSEHVALAVRQLEQIPNREHVGQLHQIAEAMLARNR